MSLYCKESVEHAFPQVGEGTGGVRALLLVDQQEAAPAHVHQRLTALLDGHGRNLGVGHQKDLSHEAIIS
ncbi:hypothetical protein [Streptomyces cyaneofuscatus]|uniref:hypothetical protein n=1 Tax=Streptomyces cyaneofuscatus TaxID=66883 RepID=UPI003655DC1B